MKRPALLSLSAWLYSLLLAAYPPDFRRRFAAEMAQVFRSLCAQTYAEAGAGGLRRLWLPVLWDGAWTALWQWWLRLSGRKVGTMDTNRIDRPDAVRPLSAGGAALAALPFLLFGLSSLAMRLETFHTGPASLPLGLVLLIHPYLIFNWIILIGLAAGLLAGFPRWAVSYLGWALLFAWWWSGMGFYGYSVGWLIALPLLAALLAPVLLRRSLQPLRRLLAGLRGDWTLLSFGLYILYAFVWVLADENHSPYLMFFIALTTLAVALGEWGYFRAVSPLRRVLSLLGGLLLASVLGVLSAGSRLYPGLPEGSQNVSLAGLIAFAALAVIMLANALLARKSSK